MLWCSQSNVGSTDLIKWASFKVSAQFSLQLPLCVSPENLHLLLQWKDSDKKRKFYSKKTFIDTCLMCLSHTTKVSCLLQINLHWIPYNDNTLRRGLFVASMNKRYNYNKGHLCRVRKETDNCFKMEFSFWILFFFFPNHFTTPPTRWAVGQINCLFC